jgi:hypothetical protein
MDYQLRAGAPFDLNNLFITPALDPGLFVNPYPDATITSADGGTFTSLTLITYDGGSIPVAGTATFNPNKVYGPNDIVNI